MNKHKISFLAFSISHMTTVELEAAIKEKMKELGILLNYKHFEVKDEGSIYTKREPVKIPELPVREVSEAEKKRNRSKIAKAEILNYYPEHGRSHYAVRCECGQLTELYCWSGSKRCPNCSKVIHRWLSFKEGSQ
jgi:hypothetical protein